MQTTLFANNRGLNGYPPYVPSAALPASHMLDLSAGELFIYNIGNISSSYFMEAPLL